ncbi:MAG: hypothetical protein LBG15_08010 [Dysgonamonadaceae bacterium]|jgi:hypothetical protein|nr:hypothetical protein [Dysgonamonadaceae bacterium]
MNYGKLEYYVSQPRLNRFLTACGNSKSKAQKLYQANIKVSQSFYPVLNLFEVFFRNICHYQVSSHFANPNWIIAEKSGFMSNPSLSASNFYLKNAVVNAERSIRQKGGTVTAGKIIAEQSFSFWTSLFDTHHYRLIGGVVIHCFPHKPFYINRNILNGRLNRIREFRNRIYHNEPVCFSGNTIDFTYAHTVKQDIYELLSWIDSDLVSYLKKIDTIDYQINVASRI